MRETRRSPHGGVRLEVRRVLVVAGINSFRGWLSNASVPQSEDRENESVVLTARSVFGLMLDLADWFPKADVLYLGAGRVFTRHRART